MDSDTFRRSLNSAVQELRNVSFLVQKEKATLEDFDTWYPEWQQQARAEPVMRWIVDSRNRIVKQGDLDLLSQMRVRYHLDWLTSGEIEVSYPPSTPLHVAAKKMLESMGNPSYGIITVRRRWTDFRLAQVELLEALAIAYARCADLIELAHGRDDQGECGIDLSTSTCAHRSLHPECMANAAVWTQASLDASSGEFGSLWRLPVRFDEEGARESVRRYGDMKDLQIVLKGGGAHAAVDLYLEVGRRILAVDDDLMTLCVFYRGDEEVHREGGKAPDGAGKVLWAEQLASKALSIGATSLLVSADVWEARVTNSELDLLPVAQRSDRTEALNVLAVSSDGRLTVRMLRYTRLPDGAADFGEVETSFMWPNYLEPLRKAWGVTEWRSAG